MSLAELSAEDRQELNDLIIEFAWRVDHGQADTVHELVTDDIEMRLSQATMLGREAVTAWGRKRSTVERTTSHVMSNVRFYGLTSDRVESDSLAIIFRHSGSGMGAARPWAVTEYQDVFVRSDGRWKFSRRVSSDVFFSEEANEIRNKL